jgi:lysophospholipid acyltransferase (LPLAT)-like uncharacterized protein
MLLQRLKLLLAPPTWRFLKATVPTGEFVRGSGMESGPIIFACLHQDILPAIMHVRSVRPALLVSNSPDGEILVKTLGCRDYRFVRGATGLDGGKALVLLRRELSAGNCVGVAVDGPEGPFGYIREGVLHLARMTGAPIVPLVARADRPLILDTWDRTVVPIPFRKMEMVRGPVLRIIPDAGEEEFRSSLAILAEFFGVAKET